MGSRAWLPARPGTCRSNRGGLLCRPFQFLCPASWKDELRMEPLSAVLRGMRLKGSIYAAWELRAPWGMDLPPGPFASFHLVERGRCTLRTSREVLHLEAGELVVLFDGQAHALLSSREAPVTPLAQLVARHPLV
ncbi:MAG: AraC family transcriptional regulator, partial [Myxococcaceae bacterium]